MRRPRLTVLKFGSSVLRTDDDLPTAAAEVARHADNGTSVLVVVSAIGSATETLLRRGRVLADHPEETALAALLATGETASAALVGLALANAGLPASVLDVARVGPFTRGPLLDAHPYHMDVRALRIALTERCVAVLPGFAGRDLTGAPSVLGRGGSDLTALFAAQALAADRCRLLKDVDGIYDADPRRRGKARRFDALSWSQALQIDGAVLQRKALQLAYRRRIPFEVGRPGSDAGTSIGGPRRAA